MTKDEAAIVAAYTGVMIGSFSDMHKYIEKVLKRPVFTHEMASKEFMDELRAKTLADFVGIEITDA